MEIENGVHKYKHNCCNILYIVNQIYHTKGNIEMY